MRIGISTSVIQRGQSGVGQYVLALLQAFLPHAAAHDFVLFVLEDDLPLFEFVRNRMQILPVSERFRPPINNIFWHQRALPALVQAERLDVLHVPSYRRLLWPRPSALVATIHDLAPFRIAKKYDWKRMFYGRVIARRLARRQDHIIAISQNTAHDIMTFFDLRREQITVVYNGIEHERFFPGSREKAKAVIAETFGIVPPFFLYVARVEHPAKNHIRLLEAFEMFKRANSSDWQLVFAGSDWHGAEVIHAAIKKSRFAADIRTLGFVSNGMLPELYRAAEVFVYPSLYEGFGLPPVEAMACGCPVISSTRGSLGEVVGEAAAIIDPEDIPALANQLAIVATDESVRNRLRAAGLAQSQKFAWERTAQETIKVYERVAATGK